MNNSTQQQNGQVHPPMTADRAKAALGNSTLLQSFLLPKAQAQQPQPTQEQPAQPSMQETMQQGQESMQNGLKDLETKIMGEIGNLKSVIEQQTPKDKNKELEDLKKQITDVLNESDTPSET